MIYVDIHYQNQIIYIYLAHAGSLPGWAKLFIKKTFFGVTCLYARSKYHTQHAKTSFDEVLDLTAVVFYFIGKIYAKYINSYVGENFRTFSEMYFRTSTSWKRGK